LTLAAGAVWLFLTAAPAALAQDAAPCPQGRISSVFIDTHSVFDLSDPELSQRFGWAYRLANRLHARTDEGVVRREILVAEGECYDVERLRDSERLLRELSFIADVDVFGVRQPDGTIHVVVDTQDEWSTRIQPRVGDGGLEGLRLREGNLLGTGQQVSAFYIDDDEQQVYGGSYSTPQLLGTRWDARLEGGRTPVGYLLSQSVSYPFVGQVGRWSFRQAIRNDDHYFEFFTPGDEGLVALWQPESRRSFELGGAYRWGTRGFNRTLIGAALTGEEISYPGDLRFADGAEDEDMVPPQPLSFNAVGGLRMMFMTGQRNIYFVRRRALDTVDGTEDVRLGVETEVALGPTLRGLSGDSDIALDLGFFAAGEVASVFLSGMQVVIEARRAYDNEPGESEWRDVYGQMDAWSYWRPSPDSRQTLVAGVSATGGWHNRVPFQLTLGGESGLRGYADHVDPGARRVVGSIEHRAYLGWPLPDLFDLGTVAFVDAGQIWAGDAPFGRDSPVRANVGVGLRAAFPPGSRQTFRLDVALPAGGDGGWSDLRVSVGVRQVVGLRSIGRDRQLTRSTRLGSAGLFAFPGGQ
jgi:hypothetical protein